MNGILIAILLVGGVGLIAAILLSIASTVFAVPVNEKEVAVREVLPGANCGSCGYQGCDAYAKALATEEGVPANLCRPGGTEALTKISEILGVEVKEAEKLAAYVRCSGDCNTCKTKAEYQGIASCKTAKMLFNGPSECSYGCVGCGDCASVCEYDAISIKDQLATVDRRKCKACGKCVDACPNDLIELLPVAKVAMVRCRNKQKGAITRANCSAGCIGCKKCEKLCPEAAITVTDNVASVLYSKCTGCGTCVENCPVGCIKI